MRQDFNSAIVPKNQLLPGVHGLRGIAALAVVLYHLIWVGNIKPPAMFDFIGRDFGFSVHLFFIISAYSLMHSLKPKVGQPNWLTVFLSRDFFVLRHYFTQ
jgi:peptidoglycan/LPS O-acetylase OafA/YrhL